MTNEIEQKPKRGESQTSLYYKNNPEKYKEHLEKINQKNQAKKKEIQDLKDQLARIQSIIKG